MGFFVGPAENRKRHMATFAEDMVAKIQAALLENPVAEEVVIDGDLVKQPPLIDFLHGAGGGKQPTA